MATPSSAPPPSFRRRFRYWFDNTLSSGTKVMVLWLTVATVGLILVVSLASTVAGVRADGVELSFGEALWSNLMRTLDPGTMGDDVGWPLRLASLTATVGGILIVSSLIGLLANGINARVAELRRGRSPILESGHTLILGWSPKIFPIVSELTIANENQGGGSVVVLAAMEKDEMDRLIAARVPATRGTRIVCRSGTPYEPFDVAVARPESAKSVIVLNPGHQDGDAQVVKTALALLRTSRIAATVPLIAEIGDAFTAAALRDGTTGAVSVVRSNSVIARITAQVCRQPGLSEVYEELLDFDGDEIYFRSVPQLEGSTFREALLAFEEAAPLGVRRADGTVVLNPSHDSVVSGDDALIAIAADDDRIVHTGGRSVDAAKPAGPAAPETAERILMIGWNQMAPDVVRELDGYVAPGATLRVHVDPAVCPPEEVDLPADLRNLVHSIHEEALDPEALRTMMASQPPDHVIVLCYKERLSEAQADARVLLTLLHLRSAIDAARTATNIVAELLDERDVGLTPRRQTDEFIVSERLTALVMTQLSENRDLGPVFDELLDEAGTEIYLKPVALYGAGSDPMPFATLVASASARGEVALGYQSKNGGDRKATLNPPKSRTFQPDPGDRLIVLADAQG